MSFTRKFNYLAAVVGLLLILAACMPGAGQGPTETPAPAQATATQVGADEPVSSDDPTVTPAATETPAGEGEVIIGQATVENIDILILESFPVQVHVLVRGYVGDGCTEIDEIQTTPEGNAFMVTITTKRPAEAVCTQILVGFEETIPLDVAGLPAGTYTVNVNGVTGTFELAVDNVAQTEEPIMVDPVSECLPTEAGLSPYFNVDGGYCFQYPNRFRIGDVFPEPQSGEENIMAVYGPPQDASLEPLQAGLSIVRQGPAGGRSLVEVVDQAISEFADLPLTRSQTTLGGQPAEVIDGLPGRTANRQLFTIYNDIVYHLTVYPTDPTFSVVKPDVEVLWEAVTGTFTFLPASFMESVSAACPAGGEQRSPYANVAHGYCLVYPSYFSLNEIYEQNVTTLSGPALDQSLEPVQAALTIQVEGAAGDRTLAELVAEAISAFPDVAVTQTETTLDGEPAIVLEGLPGRTGSRQLYTIFAGVIFHLTLTPVDEAFPQAAQDVAAVWEMVMESFTFWR
ncbi:MAG: hypothetical protein L0332_05935 [Chloroflexi bacterium]|nr:hypothetical protein [Chloroflexota bacterium]MCI0576393.1 hypothetical protein [Chloroflexota bacterium]MCI0644265.1 hypothetical protein [Chloroflexota bacterium]MCI0726248.1 hypothetical protein [Chloroflexota bacterium]